MGNLDGWSFMKDEKKECQECGMEKFASEDIGCCKDEYKHIKLQVDQKPNQHAYSKLSLPTIELHTSFRNYYMLLPETTLLSLSSHLPAFLARTSIAAYVLLCNIRI
jgi:hypothetical protein